MTTYKKTDLFRFWYAGFVQASMVMVLLHSAFEDSIGLQAYLDYVRKRWIEVNPLLWVVAGIVWLGSIIVTLYRMRARQKQVSFCEEIVLPELRKVGKKEEVIFAASKKKSPTP